MINNSGPHTLCQFGLFYNIPWNMIWNSCFWLVDHFINLINHINILFLFIHGWRRGTRVLTYILWNLSFYKTDRRTEERVESYINNGSGIWITISVNGPQNWHCHGCYRSCCKHFLSLQLWAYFYLSISLIFVHVSVLFLWRKWADACIHHH